jgi:hypothetical protein
MTSVSLPPERLMDQGALIVFDRYEGLNRPPWGATAPQHLQKPLETNMTQLSQ